MALKNMFGDIALDSSVQDIISQLADTIVVADDLSSSEYLSDQTSIGNVITFSFSSPVHQIWVEVNGANDSLTRITAGLSGSIQTPSSSLGAVIHDTTPSPITLVADTVKVLAPPGAIITVYGYRR